jgi:hypothetical protein
MASNPLKDVIEVPKYMLDILVHLKILFALYQSIQKNETEVIELLTKEIEQISDEGQGNFFI